MGGDEGGESLLGRGGNSVCEDSRYSRVVVAMRNCGKTDVGQRTQVGMSLQRWAGQPRAL